MEIMKTQEIKNIMIVLLDNNDVFVMRTDGGSTIINECELLYKPKGGYEKFMHLYNKLSNKVGSSKYFSQIRKYETKLTNEPTGKFDIKERNIGLMFILSNMKSNIKEVQWKYGEMYEYTNPETEFNW